ncbi:MAG TPA: hypothetical protein VEV87_07335, partial [Chitinophagaceae bacterium]|nr:hypothetical protein [Chitinophagaceae bacterium]
RRQAFILCGLHFLGMGGFLRIIILNNFFVLPSSNNFFLSARPTERRSGGVKKCEKSTSFQ